MIYNAKSDISETISPFNYRKKLTINHSGALTSYQIKLTVDHVNTNMKTDFGDIRFNNEAGDYIPYWIEKQVNDTFADVWIKTNLADGNTIIYMYYGNANLTSASNGTNTFDFFGDTISKFTVIGNAVQNGNWIDIPHTNVNSWGTQRITTKTDATRPTIVEFHQKQSGSLEALSLWGTGSILTNIYSFYDRVADNTLNYRAPITFLANETEIYTDVKFKLIITPTNGAIFYRDGTQKASTADDSSTTYPMVFENYQQSTTLSISNVIFRKYAATEPTVITSAEQTITAKSMSITPRESPCRVGICIIDVNVIWTNTGESATFTPSVIVDATTTHSLSPITLNTGDTPIVFEVSGLSVGNHTICPDPN